MSNLGRWVIVRYSCVGGDLIINEWDFAELGLEHDVHYRIEPASATHARLWIPMTTEQVCIAAQDPTCTNGRALKIRPIFAWYDLWIGAFYDRQKRRLYIFPVPCVGFYIDLPTPHNRSEGG